MQPPTRTTGKPTTRASPDGSENMKVGIGFAFNVWNSLYIEPNYTMPTKKDANDKREGAFSFGLSYRF